MNEVRELFTIKRCYIYACAYVIGHVLKTESIPVENWVLILPVIYLSYVLIYKK